MTYAKNTTVSREGSIQEIERMLIRNGATRFSYGWDDQGRAAVTFCLKGYFIRFLLTMPDPKSKNFTLTPTGRKQRSERDARAAWEQACRARWRSLALVIKAKLEAVQAGITVIEDEFLAHIVMPDGQTVGHAVMPLINEAYKTGLMPSRMLALPEPEIKAKG